MLYIRFNSRLIDDRSGSQDSGLTHIMRLVSFSTPWKHQKNFYPWEQKNFGFMFSGGRGFSDVFRWYKKRAIAWNGLKRCIQNLKVAVPNHTGQWTGCSVLASFFYVVLANFQGQNRATECLEVKGCIRLSGENGQIRSSYLKKKKRKKSLEGRNL